jgi:predicted O-linked N-acetylglucosamine transferase (SPINDLY family)
MAGCISRAIETYAHAIVDPALPISLSPGRGPRIRVGYLSGEIYDHSVAYPIASLVENHDRDNFEIFVYSYGHNDGSAVRARIVSASENFVAARKLGAIELARRIARDRIDILVDLTGYQIGTRSEILALRPASIQVNYLGYVGTQANDWVDYVIADAVVLPQSQASSWSETIVHLPNCYFPISQPFLAEIDGLDEGARRLVGLPDSTFVFACFNNPYKINRRTFALWMQILCLVPCAVLWLYAESDMAVANLRREAALAGIDPSRLIFAQGSPAAEHFRRHAHADLFLDTFPYGAHSTAAVSLSAGLPVLTLAGASFPSRVGASMLSAAGIPELICESADGYVKLAVDLANNRERLNGLRTMLRSARVLSPLFDAARLTANVEKAYREMLCTSPRQAVRCTS